MTYSLNTLQSSSAAEGQPVRMRAMRFAHEITLIAGFAALLFWLLAMLSFTPSDAAWSTSGTGGDVKNWGRPHRRLAGRWQLLLPGGLLGLVVPCRGLARLALVAGQLAARRRNRSGRTARARPFQPQPHRLLVRPCPAAVRQHDARMVAAVPARIAPAGLRRRRAGLSGGSGERALDGLHRLGAGRHWPAA